MNTKIIIILFLTLLPASSIAADKPLSRAPGQNKSTTYVYYPKDLKSEYGTLGFFTTAAIIILPFSNNTLSFSNKTGLIVNVTGLGNMFNLKSSVALGLAGSIGYNAAYNKAPIYHNLQELLTKKTNNNDSNSLSTMLDNDNKRAFLFGATAGTIVGAAVIAYEWYSETT